MGLTTSAIYGPLQMASYNAPWWRYKMAVEINDIFQNKF